MDINGDEDMLNEEQVLARAARADAEAGAPESSGRRIASAVALLMAAGLGMLCALLLVAADPSIICRAI